MGEVEGDVKRFQELLSTIVEQSNSLGDFTKQANENLTDYNGPSKGIGLLEIKNHSILSYLINLAMLVLRKLRGQSIKESPAIDRLVELRVVLERIKPIELKLQYQINKLLRSLISQPLTSKERDVLSFRPHPQCMNVENEEGEESESASEDEDEAKSKTSKSTGKYVPPKLIAAPYVEKRDRADEILKRRLMKPSILEDLREEYFDAPKEISGNQSLGRALVDKAEKRQKEYEEEYFTRLRLPKGNENAMQSAEDTFGIADFFAGSSTAQGKRKRKGKKSKYSKKKKSKRKR